MVKNLKKLRKEKGLSQQRLAAVLGISQQSVNKYENHNVEPDIAILTALADFFGTTIDHLVGRTSGEDRLMEAAIITPEERALITGYRKLSATERVCIDTLIRTYLSQAGKQPEE